MHNPVNINTFNFKPFCSGYTISFNIELIRRKFPNALFVHFQTDIDLLYKQFIFCREAKLIDDFIINDFKEYLNLDINKFSLDEIKEKNFNYNNMIQNIFKGNSNFIDLGQIDSFKHFILTEQNLKDFFYIHSLDTDFNINQLKKSIDINETKFIDYLNFKSKNLHIPNIYTINALISDFIFNVAFDLKHVPSYYNNLKIEIENAY